MKRNLILVSVAVLSFVLLSSLAPRKRKKSKQFRGTVTYDISYESSKMSDVQLAKLPTSMKVKMYDGMSMFDMVMGPVVYTYITRPKADKFTILIELGDKKAAMVKKYSETNSDSLRKYTTQIDLSKDTKVIAGYTCNKAVVTFIPKKGVEDEEHTYSIYYSPELGNKEDNIDGPYAGINGLLMESYDVKPGLITKMVATEVKKGKVKDLDFLMPSDYKEFSNLEDMQKYLMGQ